GRGAQYERVPSEFHVAGRWLHRRRATTKSGGRHLEGPEPEIEATRELAKAVMEGACAPVLTLSVPLVVETGAARNWDEAH
ncbi:MAG: hypothetical protein ACREFL_14210, partial [Stellaceae bacterium]